VPPEAQKAVAFTRTGTAASAALKLGTALGRPVPLIVWACFGIIIPLIGPIVLAYTSYKLKRSPASPESLKSARAVALFGTIYTLFWFIMMWVK
jgi:hypothetical protein